ncbi:autotransporter outer membrane beta-barrel domain-containing protein [Pyruvatibacter mobilis]|uniref:autotransporter outer membrane beta-barrel domain-containing protein n=1 Tax=Pyruvatibacter mobilis TaxID=1712261 RepID=UPI003C797F02
MLLTTALASLATSISIPALAVVGANGTDGTSVGLNDTVVRTSTTTGINGSVTDLTTLAGVNNGDQFQVRVNGAFVANVSVNTGDTLQDLAVKLAALNGVRATATATGTNDTISITSEDVNTRIQLANVTGTPLSATGVTIPGFPGIITADTTPGGNATDGADASTAGAPFSFIGADGSIGGNGGAGGTTAYNLTPTNGGNGGAGGHGFVINGPVTQVELSSTATVIGGGNGGAGGAGSGGGADGTDGAGGVGIRLNGAGLPGMEIVNRGTISGGLGGDGTTRNFAILLDNSGNTLQMLNGSSLVGDVNLGTSNGTLVLDGNGTEDANFTGVGTLTANDASSWTLTGNINPNVGGINVNTVGSSTLTVAGTLSGTTLTKSGDGLLVVNGTTGTLIFNGGTLGGAGTVGNLTANAGSRIAPGNSIGTLNVAGNAGFANGSVYAVEVDRNGNADRLAATGTVTINPGATVTVTAENGTDDGSTYAVSTAYTIIAAGGGVTGTFGSVTENFAFLDASLGYGANTVILTLTRNSSGLASAATTANQRAAAGGVSSLGTGNAISDAVIVLSQADARAAFDSLSGEIHASAAGLFLQNSRFARTAAGNRVRASFNTPEEGAGGAGVWVHGYGNWGDTDGDGNAASMDQTAGGVFFGADAEIFDGWRGGLMAGYGDTSFDVDARTSSADADSYTIGAYAGHQAGATGLHLGASFAVHDVTSRRTVTAGALTNSLTADYSAHTAQLFGELGHGIDTGIARFEPFAGASVIHQYRDDFSETGGAAALRVGSTERTLGVTTLGVRADRQVAAADDITTSLNGSLGWAHAYGDLETDTSMQFATGDAFTISGAPLDRDVALIEAGVTVSFGDGISLVASYDGELGDTVKNHGVTARLAVRF